MNVSSETFPESPRLIELGWDSGFAHAMTRAPAGHMPGRVIAQHRGTYRIAGPDDELTGVIAGRFRCEHTHEAGYPAVGDWVVFARAGTEGTAAIVEVLPRRSAFRRKRPGTESGAQVIAANIDLALIAVALSEPLNARRLERYLALAWESGAVPLVVLTKADLCAEVDAAVAGAMALSPGVEVVAVSSGRGIGLDRLLELLRPGRTAVILGQSGVGKSTLTNTLLGEDRLRTRAVRKDGKGQHTTTHRELFRLRNGALLIDTPGLREVGLWDATQGVRSVFDDIEALARECRFGDCRHGEEPDCAVQAAVREGALDPDRLEGWRRLERELDYLERRQDRAASAQWKAGAKAAQRAARAHVQRKRR